MNERQELMMLRQQAATMGERPSFGQKSWEDLLQRTSNFENSKGPSLARGLNIISQGVGLVGDVGANAFGSAFPETTKYANEKIGNAVNRLAKTETGKAAFNGYNDFATNHPLANQLVGDVANIGSAFLGAGSGKAVGGALKNGAEKVGDALVRSGDRISAAKRADFVQDLTTPKLVGQAKKDAAAKLKESDDLLRTSGIAPNARDMRIIDEVSKTEISPWKSKVKNREIIESVSRTEAASLKAQLAAKGLSISDDDLLEALTKARGEVAGTNYVRGGKGAGAGAAEDVTNGALDIIQKHPQTAEGMLAARKEFDQWVINQQGEKMLDPAKDQAVSDAIAATRQSMNDLIAQNAPSVDVAGSLSKQSALIDAAKNINTKLDPAGSNLLQRGIGAVTDKLPKNLADRLGATAALGGIGLTLGAGPATVAAGIYGAGKVATSATARKALGETVSGIGAAAPAIGGAAGISMQGMEKSPTELKNATRAMSEREELEQLRGHHTATVIEPLSYNSEQPSLMDKIKRAESNGNPNVKNPLSSASGLYQFTNATWRDSVGKWGKKYNVDIKDKNNPQAQEAMMQELTNDNARILQSKGVDPSDGNLYFAHFMGPNAATKAIGYLGTGRQAALIFPKEAKANPSIFFNGTQPRSIEEVYRIITNKVA